MCSFNYGGQSYETLDYSVMSSTPRRSYTEGTKSFNSRAEQEMRELEPEDYKHPFINVYSESGYVYHTGEPKKALRLSLVGQELHLFAKRQKNDVQQCNGCLLPYRLLIPAVMEAGTFRS